MAEETESVYEFGPFRLNAAERLLTRDGQPVAISPTAFNFLHALVRGGGRPVAKDELLREVWQGRLVGEANIHVQTSAVRKALGESPDGRKYIEVLPGWGYRLAAKVRTVSTSEPEGGGAEDELQSQAAQDEFPPGTTEGHVVSSPHGETAAPPHTKSRGLLKVIAAGLISVAFLAITLGLYQYFFRQSSAHLAPFQRMKVTRLTTSGDAAFPALSPDGKFVAYVTGNAGQDSGMWLAQVGTTGAVQVKPPEKVILSGTAFSPDGQYLYYVERSYQPHVPPVLYRMPTLGGSARTPVLELAGLVGVISLSPDGRRVAYVRAGGEDGVTALMVVNLDGTGARQVATRKSPAAFASGKAGWSLDGRSIACITIDGNPDKPSVVEISVEDGTEKTLVSGRWNEIRDVVWLSEPLGLLMTAKEEPFGLVQIWFVSYPDGETRRVTNDANSYIRLSVTGDGRAFVTAEVDTTSNIWVAPTEDLRQARQVTSGKFDGLSGLRWAAGDKIVFASARGGHRNIWIMNSDGTDQRQLTDDLYVDSEPSLSPDGRYVVFTSDRSGAKHIWRVNLDGRDLRQLTDGKAEDSPQCTPDGRWVVYNSWDAGTPTVWRVPAEGGQPEQIVKHESVSPAVSPDGRFIAYTHTSKGEKPPIRALTVVALEGGSPVREFSYHHPLSPNSVRWTADGRALTFLDNYGGTGRLWRQPVAGGAEQILAEFKGDGPYLYDWSPDGRQIALARGPLVRDIVLISDFR